MARREVRTRRENCAITWRLYLPLLAVGACSAPVEPVDADGVPDLTYGPVAFAPGEESEDICVSWTLETTETTYVTAITSTNGPGIHHSNWFWVPSGVFDGPDGTWSCTERGFDSAAAGVIGGIIFGTSTQAPSDEQRFADGGALAIPAGARIIGNIHVLNASAATMDANMRLELETVPADEVAHELNVAGFLYQDLSLPPRARSEFTADCAIGETYRTVMGTDPDFKIYYTTTHYHGLGTLARAEIVGGPRDGETIVETHEIGDAQGTSLAEPLDLTGVETLRFTCQYDNPGDSVVGWGIGDQEMCAIGFYTDSPLRIAARVGETTSVTDRDGVMVHSGECAILALP